MFNSEVAVFLSPFPDLAHEHIFILEQRQKNTFFDKVQSSFTNGLFFLQQLSVSDVKDTKRYI